MYFIYLASENEDSVDVGKNAMKTEVNVRTDQRKNRREDTGARLELWRKTQFSYKRLKLIAFCIHVH